MRQFRNGNENFTDLFEEQKSITSCNTAVRETILICENDSLNRPYNYANYYCQDHYPEGDEKFC